MEIPTGKRETRQTLSLDKGFRDAVADHLRHRWPAGTAKFAARAYDLTLDRAREAVAGRSSLTTLEQIVKRGGWPVGLALLAAVIGYGIEQYIAEMREANAERGRRIAEMGRSLWPLPADRPRSGRGASGSLDRRERLVGDRSSGRQG